MQLYILNPDGVTLCNLSNDNDSIKAFNFHDSKFTCYLNSAEVFEFSCPTGQHEDSKYIQMGNHVIFKYGNDYHLFTITEIEDDHAEAHTIKVYCEGASMLLLNSVIHPSKTDNQTPEQALNIALATTDWRIGRVDVYGNKNIEFNYETVLEGIKRLCELYECDAQFRIEYSPQTGITGKYVDLLEHIGSFKGHRFEYGVNVSNVTRKVNSDNVVTAVIPIGNNDLNITNIECEVSRHGFDKPKGIAYVALAEEERAKIAQSPYHIFGTLQVDSDDAYTLALKAWEHLNENTEPQVEYSFNPAEMEFEAELGDDVYCIDRDLGLQLQARVSEKTICFEDSSKNSITLINFEEKESNINLELINQIQSQLKDLEIDNNVIISDKMPTPETGKPITWVDTTPGADGKVTVQTWDGQQWLDHISGKYVDTVINQAKEEVKEEIQDEYTVYISQNTELPVFKQASQPERGIYNQLWLDTSVIPYVWKRYNGTTWEELITLGVDLDANEKIVKVEQNIDEMEGTISSKISKTEAEALVNTAIESLTGDGQNLLLYGTCSDVPRLADTGEYTAYNTIVTITTDEVLKIQPNGNGSVYFQFGKPRLTNGIQNDAYTLSFDIEFPSGSAANATNVYINWYDSNNRESCAINNATVLETISSTKIRVSHTYTFTGYITGERNIEIMIDSSSTEAIVLLDNVKLERGTEATAFSKNVNELTAAELAAVKNRITNAESAIEQHADSISQRVTKTTYDVDMANLTSKIDSAETAIEQNAEAITQRATKDEFNALGSRVSANEASITTMNNQISLKVNSSDFTSLEQTVGELLDLETRVNNAEIKISDDKIVSTVMESSLFEIMMNEKADTADLGSFATLNELESAIEGLDITGTIDSRVIQMLQDGNSNLNLQFTTKAETEQTKTAITQNFSYANGLNLLKNSTGFAGKNFWVATNTNYITTSPEPTLDSYGIGCAFHFKPSQSTVSTTLRQDFVAEVGETYTLSAYINKRNNTTTSGQNGEVYVQFMRVTNGATSGIKSIILRNTDTTNGYEVRSVQYTATKEDIANGANLAVRIYGYPYAEFSVAGVMLHRGSIPLKWNLSSGEVANSSVITDYNGIRVNQKDSNGNTTGYTSITPNEFAGYYDVDGDGTYEKVFYLNDDETVTKKVRATNEITMGSIKIVNFSGGWAFVKTT